MICNSLYDPLLQALSMPILEGHRCFATCCNKRTQSIDDVHCIRLVRPARGSEVDIHTKANIILSTLSLYMYSLYTKSKHAQNPNISKFSPPLQNILWKLLVDNKRTQSIDDVHCIRLVRPARGSEVDIHHVLLSFYEVQTCTKSQYL
jgi:hypothetical protein